MVITINGRHYDEAVSEVCPPGPLVPEPIITQAPAPSVSRLSPVEGRIHDPEYDFDESDHSDSDRGETCIVHRITANNRHVPQFWGVRMGEGFEGAECDNTLCNMLSWHTYVSRDTNVVYVDGSAAEASWIETQNWWTYFPPRGQVYTWATRVIPLDLSEVERLHTIVGNAGFGKKGTTLRKHVEAFLLLLELYQVAQRVIPEYETERWKRYLPLGHLTLINHPKGWKNSWRDCTSHGTHHYWVNIRGWAHNYPRHRRLWA